MATRKWLPAVVFAAVAPALTAQADDRAASDAMQTRLPNRDWLGSYYSRNSVHIATDDGRPLPGPPTVMSDCAKWDPVGWATIEIHTVWGKGYSADCVVVISLAGYRSVRVYGGGADEVVLKRLADSEGSLISFTSLLVPKAAAKQFDKARAAMFKRKWGDAEVLFRRAIDLFPDYAAAWDELGRVLDRRGRPRDAEAAFERSVGADPRFIKPYVRLAELAAREQRWADALARAEQARKLNPIEFPEAYYWAGVAQYNLGDLQAAEKDALRVLDFDVDHVVPRALSLLGLIREKRGDWSYAALYYREFLSRAPNDPTAATVRARVADLDARLLPPIASP